MPVSIGRTLLIIFVVSMTTYFVRLIPFLIFKKADKIPEMVQYVGRMLPPAVIAMLVVYCLKSVKLTAAPFGLPEMIASLVVIVLHVWKRNNLLSIGTGTVLYMVLVQFVFV